MSFIEDDELRKNYDKYKYRVKLWEHEFKKEHGRVPSKVSFHEVICN